MTVKDKYGLIWGVNKLKDNMRNRSQLVTDTYAYVSLHLDQIGL